MKIRFGFVILGVSAAVALAGCSAPTSDEQADESSASDLTAKTFSIKDLKNPSTPATPITISNFDGNLVIGNGTTFSLRNDGFRAHKVVLTANEDGKVLKSVDLGVKATSTFTVAKGNHWYNLSVSYVDASGRSTRSLFQFQTLVKAFPTGGGGSSGASSGESCEAAGGHWQVLGESGVFCVFPTPPGELPGGG